MSPSRQRLLAPHSHSSMWSSALRQLTGAPIQTDRTATQPDPPPPRNRPPRPALPHPRPGHHPPGPRHPAAGQHRDDGRRRRGADSGAEAHGGRGARGGRDPGARRAFFVFGGGGAGAANSARHRRLLCRRAISIQLLALDTIRPTHQAAAAAMAAQIRNDWRMQRQELEQLLSC
jgi:hypothetical protein